MTLPALLDGSLSTFPIPNSQSQAYTGISITFYIINDSIIASIFTCLFLIVNKDNLVLNVLDVLFCFAESFTTDKNKWVDTKTKKTDSPSKS